MSKYDYEYRGLMAETWDLLRSGIKDWPDTPQYRKLIKRYGQPALDVGCGTGRILLPFLLDGLDVDGVDNSPEMLARCREKAQVLNLSPTLYEQTMEGLDLPRKYKTIFVPSASFQLVTDLSKA
ncbi:MAG: class I SAM-dependent methyltransferase, partial [Anaerolineae bacterium]|nr:class I SAM-dependent methyltransferase [Anaerolineae bacterium]